MQIDTHIVENIDNDIIEMVITHAIPATDQNTESWVIVLVLLR